MRRLPGGAARATFSNGQSAPRQLGFSGFPGDPNRSSGSLFDGGVGLRYCQSVLHARQWEPCQSENAPIDLLVLSRVDETGLLWLEELRYRSSGPVPYLLLNLDDPNAGALVKPRVPYITFGHHPQAHVRSGAVVRDRRGTTISLETPLGCKTIRVQEHFHGCETWVLAAVALGLALRTELDAIAAALEEPGALDRAA